MRKRGRGREREREGEREREREHVSRGLAAGEQGMGRVVSFIALYLDDRAIGGHGNVNRLGVVAPTRRTNKQTKTT